MHTWGYWPQPRLPTLLGGPVDQQPGRSDHPGGVAQHRDPGPHVSAFQLGVLEALSYAGYPLFGLLAGSWVDRLSRRRVLIAADAVRLVTLAALPMMAWAGYLTYGALLLAGFITGAAAAFFAAAYQAYLPAVTGRAQIVDGNRLLALSNSTAQVGGPAASGLLIAAFGAANALAADAVSYAASIISLTRIRRREHPPPVRRHALFADVRQRLRLVWAHPLLRRLTLTTTMANLGRGLCLELFFAVRLPGAATQPASSRAGAGNRQRGHGGRIIGIQADHRAHRPGPWPADIQGDEGSAVGVDPDCADRCAAARRQREPAPIHHRR